MNLPQLERMESELKQERYGLSKIQGPRGEDWKLPGTLLRKPRGIYIIMCIDSRIYLQDLQAGLCVKGGVFIGGYEQDLLDTETDLDMSPLLRGLRAMSPYLLHCVQHAGDRGSRWLWPTMAPASWAWGLEWIARDAEEREGKSRRRTHRRRRSTGGADFSKGTGLTGRRPGLQAGTTLRCSRGREKTLRRCGLAHRNFRRGRFCSGRAPSDESATTGGGHGIGSEGLAAQSGEVRATRCRSRGQGSGFGFIGARRGSSCRERHGRQRQGAAGLRRVPTEHKAGGNTGSDGPHRAGRAG
jgi:hypothetical protein